MKRLFKLAQMFQKKLAEEPELKSYRKRLDSDKVEDLVEKALNQHEGEDVDLSYHNQHYGWFKWNEEESQHEQKDMNDFEADDKIKDVRKFVHNLKKVKLEKYE